MEKMKNDYPLAELAEALAVSRSGFHAHQHKEKGSRRQRDKELAPLLTSLFEESRKTYGSPRLTHALRQAGQRCGKNRVRRLMRASGLRPRQKRRFRPLTTQSNHDSPIAENWLERIPSPERPNQVWVADITYLPTAQGWLYLACELDLCSRRVTGWATRADLSSLLVSEAWARAIFSTPPDPGLLHHSDRGSQYASGSFRALLESARAAASMSRKANPYDNAVMESFFATLKTECFAEHIPQTHAEAKLMLFDYIEGFYNPRRLHSSLGYLSPHQFEISLNPQQHEP